jgi:hypothetical protein
MEASNRIGGLRSEMYSVPQEFEAGKTSMPCLFLGSYICV